MQLQEIIQNGLDGNEYVSVLSWVLKTYNSEELMGRDYLKDETKNLKPLLPSKVMKEVQEEFLSVSNLVLWGNFPFSTYTLF